MQWGSIQILAVVLLSAVPAVAEEPVSPPTARFGDVAPGAQSPPPAEPHGGAAEAPAPLPPVASPYVYREVVDPFDVEPAAPAPIVSRPIHEVDDLLIVNPYSTMLVGREGGRTRYFAPPPDASVPGTLLVQIPSGFRGAVYLNGVALPPVPGPMPMLPGEHAITVVPVRGEPFTVWVALDAGESRRFRFALGEPAPPRRRTSDSVSTWFPSSGAELK